MDPEGGLGARAGRLGGHDDAVGMASIKPTPKTGVGILKMRLLFLVWYAKSSWLIVQPLASPVESRRPLMTNSAWTPPSRVPSALYL